jgi:hypothetical protein
MENNKAKFSMVAKEDLECGRNMKNTFSSSGKSYSEIVEDFADDHDGWVIQFLEGWTKMVNNGYTGKDLTDGPVNSWLGYHSWAKFSDTEDFEDYITKNNPAKISDNSKVMPTIMSNEKDTFADECGFKSGMTEWNKNFDRCPTGLFNFTNVN